MWLIVIFICALFATTLYLIIKDKERYQLNFLALMLWGAFIMVLVDHAITFMESGGEFIEVTTDGLVQNSIILGLLMVTPLVAVWFIVFSTKFKLD